MPELEPTEADEVGRLGPHARPPDGGVEGRAGPDEAAVGEEVEPEAVEVHDPEQLRVEVEDGGEPPLQRAEQRAVADGVAAVAADALGVVERERAVERELPQGASVSSNSTTPKWVSSPGRADLRKTV